MTGTKNMVPIEVYAVVETNDDHCLVIWHEKEGERKFVMYFSPAALSLYFTSLNRGVKIAHGALYDIFRRNTGMRLERIDFPRTDNIRFVPVARFVMQDGTVIEEELMCSDAVSLGLYAKVPFNMEESVLKHASLLSGETIRHFEEQQSRSRSQVLSDSLSELPDDLPKH